MVLEWIAYSYAVNTISKALKILKNKNEYINEHSLTETLKSICGGIGVKVRRTVNEYVITFNFPKVTVTVTAIADTDELEIESVDIEFPHDPEEEEPEEVIVQ
jgi:hypothetical protein